MTDDLLELARFARDVDALIAQDLLASVEENIDHPWRLSFADLSAHLAGLVEDGNTSSPEFLPVLRAVLALLDLRGDWDAAERWLEQSIDTLPHDEAWDAHNWLAWFDELRGRYDAAEAHARHALAQLPADHDDPSRLATTLNRLAKVLRTRERFEESLALYEESLQHAERSQDAAVLTSAFISKGLALWHLERFEAARDCCERALAIATAGNVERRAIHAHNNLGLIWIDLGLYDDARRSIERALTASIELGDVRERGLNAGNLGTALMHLGLLDEAQAQIEAACRAARRVNSAYRAAKAHVGLAEVHLQRGTDEGARRACEEAAEARRAGTALGVAEFRVVADATAAVAWTRLGELTRAEAAARRAWTGLHADTRPRPYDRLVCSRAHHALQVCGDPATAQRALAHGRKRLDQVSSAITDPELRHAFLTRVAVNRSLASGHA
jgi:tetratricopeptide (TPR) repeat protein